MFINVFLANVTISHHLRTLENLLLSGVFRGGGRGCKVGVLARNVTHALGV